MNTAYRLKEVLGMPTFFTKLCTWYYIYCLPFYRIRVPSLMLIQSQLPVVGMYITCILTFHGFVEPLQSDKKLVDITVHAT